MQNYYFKILVNYSLIVLSLSFISCTSIIAEDISDDIVITVTPTEGQNIDTNLIHFKWDNIEFADEYNIQVVNPNFNNPIEYSIDSIVSITNINFPLSFGSYQWRIKAMNNISETNFSEPINFTVDENTNLSNQVVILNNPEDNFYINSNQLNFVWEILPSADLYTIQLVKGNIFSNDIIFQATPSTNSYETSSLDLEDSEYTWKVKGVNTTSETPFSIRTLFYDTTIPNTPNLLNPSDNYITNSPVTFYWNSGVDTGAINSPITHFLEFSLTNDFNSLFDSVEISDENIEYDFNTIGTYYWRVKSKDLAGNSSVYSEIRSIIIE